LTDNPTQPETAATPVADLSFEAAMAELEKIVSLLERGDLDLEASISAYERGEALKKHCEKKLAEAELRVEKIRVGEDGKATGADPFEPS